MGEIFNVRNILIYLLMINLIGFLAMGIDKLKAKKGEWRISENTLLWITILGGGIGTITGMYTFRHKTQKAKFVYGFPIILVLEIIFVICIIIMY